MVEADGRNAATVERSVLATASGGGRACAAGAVERLAAEGDGVAPVGLVEALRVGSAMLCPQGVMGDAVAPKRWLSRPPPEWRAGMRGEAVERWGRRKVTTLRLPRWRRRSGLAARCCVHKERWATPSRQSTRSGGRHLRWRRRHARRGRRVWGRRRETGRWWARSSRGRRVHETKQILIQGVLQKCAFWKASRCDM